MKFTTLSGDVNWVQYGAKLVSPKLNNGEFDYWLVIEFINVLDATGETWDGNRYNASISAVSPAQAGQKNLDAAFGCCGIDDEELEKNELVQVEALHSYGVHSPLWNQNGNNAYKLMREAKKQAQLCAGLFGFYMDTPKNKIGTTGWEAIKGDTDSAMARIIATGSTEGRILAKMHGITLPN